MKKHDILEYYLKTTTIKNIINIFIKNFYIYYNNLNKQYKRKYLKYNNLIFKNWYYSPLVKGEITSPANIINTQIQNNFGNKYIILPKINRILNKNKTTLSLDRFSKDDFVFFSLNNHPIIKDLKIVVSKFSPDIELDSQDNLLEKDKSKLFNKLTFSDYNYLNFLTSVAFKLNLIKKLPSLYTNRAQINYNNIDFFELNKKDQFKKIVNAYISHCSNVLSNLIPEGYSLFSSKDILHYLKNPIPIEELMYNIFYNLGIDIYDFIYTLDENNMDEYSKNTLSMLYMLRSFVDLYLLCPFSLYLQIIQPIYFHECDLMELSSSLHNSLNNEELIITLLFNPGILYDITPLGKDLLFEKNEKPIANNQSFKKITNFCDIFNHITKKNKF